MKNILVNRFGRWIYLWLFLIFFITPLNLKGQDTVLSSDSILMARLKAANTKADSIKGYISVFVNKEVAEEKMNKYVEEALRLVRTEVSDSTKGNLYLSIGVAYGKINAIKEATHFYDKSLRLGEMNSDSLLISKAYYQLGRMNYYQGDVNLAIKYLIKNSQYIPEGVSLKSKIASKIALGTVYNESKKTELADSLFHLVIRDAKITGTSMYLALGYSNLAEIKLKINQVDSAFYFVRLGKEINNKIEYKLGIAWSNYIEGKAYGRIGEWGKANQSVGKSIAIWEELKSLTDLAYGYAYYAKIKGELGDYKQAYQYDIKNRTVNDSIRKEENIRHIQELEKRYQSEKDSLKLANVKLQLNQEKAERNLEHISAEKRFTLFFFIGVVLVVNSIYFIYKFRVTKKAKSIIEEQHIALELKNKEIMDSINYAKRIQNTIIPSVEMLETHLPASFVFYRPKDIVAGDFYWLEQVGDWTFCAVADCTGHGVPGAMVSVVCANALNKIILEKGEKEPGKILDKVRDIVINQFYKSGEGINDGMDISLCAFNFKTLELNWSGANNPLWLIRGNELIEEKGDKQPIGKYIHDNAFRNHSFDLQKNDVIYMFTDGFADQFGGENGKKLKNKNFKNWILSVHHESMDKQYELTDAYFKFWKGTLDQLDDVCVMGIRVI